MGIAISTNKLTKQFGKRLAVNKMSMQINKGEIFALLGTNGAGKTTTIKMLSCLLTANSGEIDVLGMNPKQEALDIKKVIGVSPQENAIAGHLNTLENLRLMGGIYGMTRAQAKDRAFELMQLLELENRKEQSRKLSGGLQRRLSIAMALMSDPEILMLDEPTLGLDPHSRKSVWNYIEKLKGEKTILLTTHYLEEADALADKIAIMHEGEIIASGTSDELKAKYLGEKRIEISSENISDELKQDLKPLNYAFEIKNKTLIIKGPELDFYKIIDVLKAKQVIITGIKQNEPSLEDVFIALTKKKQSHEIL